LKKAKEILENYKPLGIEKNDDKYIRENYESKLLIP